MFKLEKSFSRYSLIVFKLLQGIAENIYNILENKIETMDILLFKK